MSSTPLYTRLSRVVILTKYSTNSKSTRDWFKRMASLNHILKAKDGDVYDKVKIAVLDTGVDPCDAASVYIDGYRDFVSGNDSVKCDNTGHGTTSVNLIFDMFDSASVHVVRIFETDVANENTHDIAIQVSSTFFCHSSCYWQ